MIEFDNLSKRYEGGFEALKKISFQMESGEMAFLTGRSGAGKSTLLKLLMLMGTMLPFLFRIRIVCLMCRSLAFSCS